MRQIDDSAIKRYSDVRFRSEYDYALFEYYRSAKVIAYLEQAGVSMAGPDPGRGLRRRRACRCRSPRRRSR